MTDSWPLGCKDPDSCARHGRCMYIRCRHETDQDLKSDIDKAVATEEARRLSYRMDGTQQWQG